MHLKTHSNDRSLGKYSVGEGDFIFWRAEEERVPWITITMDGGGRSAGPGLWGKEEGLDDIGRSSRRVRRVMRV